MPDSDLDLLVRAAEAAGDTALTYSGETARRWDKPDGAGPVTEADLAVNDALERILCAERPDYGWLSEESEDDATRLDKDAVFIVDPIDGTRSFVEGSSTWAHALAIAKQGVVTAAVIYLPMRDLMYVASAGQGARCNGAPISPSDRGVLDDSVILAARPTFDARHWDGDVPNIRRAYRPSLAYRMAVVAEGRFDGMLTLRKTWEWDVAAGDLILREAGAQCSDRFGDALRFNNKEPFVQGIVAGGDVVSAELLGRLSGH